MSRREFATLDGRKPIFCFVKGGEIYQDAWGMKVPKVERGSWRCSVMMGIFPDNELIFGKGEFKETAYDVMLENYKDAKKYRIRYYKEVLAPKSLQKAKIRKRNEELGLSGIFNFGGRDCRVIAVGKRPMDGKAKVSYMKRIRKAEKRATQRLIRRGPQRDCCGGFGV